MLFKQLKHDLLFGRTMFIVLGVSIVLAAVAGQILYHVMEDTHTALNTINISIFLLMGLVLGFYAVHLSQFVEKSMYGDSGYLTLTLPVTRGRLLISKLLAAWIWFSFILFAVLIGIIILQGTQHPDPAMMQLLPNVSMNLLAYYFNLIFMFFFSVNLLFFGLTLYNSVFGRWKVPGFIPAILCLTTIFGYAAAVIRLFNRQRIRVPGPDFIYEWEKITGLNVGRVPLFDSYFDLFIAALGLILGLAAMLGTWYLLKKRVSLQ